MASPHVAGPLLGLAAAVSLSIAALAIRRGTSTDDGSSFDALLVVLVMNVLLLTPIALVLYYPDYGLTVRSLWAFAAAGLVGPTTLLPLKEIGSILVENLLNGSFTPQIVQTAGAVFAGFTLGVASGFPVGLVLWKYDLLGEISDPFLLSMHAVPLYIFYPLFIIVFG